MTKRMRNITWMRWVLDADPAFDRLSHAQRTQVARMVSDYARKLIRTHLKPRGRKQRGGSK